MPNPEKEKSTSQEEQGLNDNPAQKNSRGIKRGISKDFLETKNQTDFRFDTYRINTQDLKDPKIIKRLKKLNDNGLINYYNNANNKAVKDYILKLLNQRNSSIKNLLNRPLNLIIHLKNVTLAPHPNIIENEISNVYKPLVKEAGKELVLIRTRSPLPEEDFVDLTLTFVLGSDINPKNPCGKKNIRLLGNADGSIFINPHIDFRVCGALQMLNGPTRELSYIDQIERVFEPDEPALARFIGDTAVHELAHMIADLPHSSYINNYLYATKKFGSNLPVEERTKEKLRQHITRKKQFNNAQKQMLIKSIFIGKFKGGIHIEEIK